MEDDLKKFAGAALDAINNGNTTAGTGSGVVDNYVRSKFGNILAGSASGVAPLASAVDTAEKNQTKAQIAKLQNEQDPSKFQKVRKDDGGFDFLDPNGNKISVSQYAAATGLTRADALKDSENPLDQQFVNDYNNLQDLTTDINNGDSQKVATFMESNKGILPGTTPAALYSDLIKKYPHIFGQGTYNDTVATSGNKPLFQAGQVGTASASGSGISGSDYGY